MVFCLFADVHISFASSLPSMTSLKSVAFALASLNLAASTDLPSLPSVNETDLTVSGLSSGGFMAVQMHVAYSARFRGAGVFAGGPWYCAQGQETTALVTCMSTPFMLNVDNLVSLTHSAVQDGNVDAVKNMKDDKIWIFSGSKDSVVKQEVVKKLEQYYQSFITADGAIKTNYTTPSEHAFPTTDFGNWCWWKGAPYINNCHFDGAAAMMEHLYGAAEVSTTKEGTGKLIEFDQSAFFPSGKNWGGLSMGSTGYLYVPAKCAAAGGAKKGSCGLHVALHGCQQTLADIGTKYVENTGINAWADAHDLAVLYPQATKSMLSNPEGCWDWWGYTDGNYAYKSGQQPTVIMAMVDHILGKKVETIVV
mmetsp:Transcript_22183/g.48507  ORF Transcript_22183/g.48507 Transcript_22183/m.48507 type:complete len:365 (+) Transcript_22183:1-1095(+)